MAKTHHSAKRVREKLRQAAITSGKTNAEIGLLMGFSKLCARQAVSRLLDPDAGYEPRLSTLLFFADAVGKSLRDIL